jgi:prevent-host-death family protein
MPGAASSFMRIQALDGGGAADGALGEGQLAHVTIHDYIMTMDTVRVAELKARLSEYLRRVRRGHPVTVLDRDTPIARIVPYAPDAATLSIRRPVAGAGKPWQVRLPRPLKIDVDIVELLMEERRPER